MLHHPFRKVEDLLYIRDIHDQVCATYTEAYAECRALCDHSLERDGLVDEDMDADRDVDDLHESSQEEEDNVDEEWEQLARVLPNRDTGENVDPEDNLGLREMDMID
jgi:hypothetical protein